MKIKTVITLLLALFVLSSCSNRRYYFGVDDYGEPERFEHSFKTRGHGDSSERGSSNKY